MMEQEQRDELTVAELRRYVLSYESGIFEAIVLRATNAREREHDDQRLPAGMLDPRD